MLSDDMSGNPTLHPRAYEFSRSGLFRDIESFSELEERISELPTEIDRGAAFEVFAEAYLATQRRFQIKQIWSDRNIPRAAQKALKIPANDMGIDGVFQSRKAGYGAFQVKFRGKREGLTWTDLKGFFGLADRAHTKIVFTNSSDLANVTEHRIGFLCVRGSDLDRMKRSDFENVNAWLEGDDPVFEPLDPWPHQETAIQDCLTTLATTDRATCVMACGTGKTLVGLWIAERLQSQVTLVLVPSLQLLRQSLHAWLENTESAEPRFCCVCSDNTVLTRSNPRDELKISQTDLDFPVTTNSDDVRAFLAGHTDDRRIVFSTYQSAHVVAAAMGGNDSFDLAIFDEAHKTAGRSGTRFTRALKDDNIRINKRLFMTATPRLYNVSKRTKHGDAKRVFSMDDTDSYGLRAHELGFAEAVDREVICGFKVLISVVTDEMVNEALLNRGEVLIDNEVVHARRVANQLALQQAAQEYNTNKIVTFHSRVAQAQSFVSDGREGIRTHMPGYQAYHVNGNQRTHERDDILNKEFAVADKAIVSNARCLTEGVDVPSIDMVAFLSPKKSKVDIAQAVGRAMRKDGDNPKKKFGYVLLPVFLEMLSGGSVEEAVERSELDEVWNVLSALQDHDSVFAEIIREIRQDYGQKKHHRRKDGIERRFKEKVEVLGPPVQLEQLRNAISTRCVMRLSCTWDEMYGRLAAYKELHGDCNVPQKHVEDGHNLGSWVAQQRMFYNSRTKHLSAQRTERLEDLGFMWDPQEAQWEQMFDLLVAYKEEHGDCHVRETYEVEGTKLGLWVLNQRSALKSRTRKITPQRIEKLTALGFAWHHDEVQWNEMFERLVVFKENNGHCNVPRTYLVDGYNLGAWVNTQKAFYKTRPKKLSDDRIKRLEALGVVWDRRVAKWEAHFELLVVFKENNGHCNVPQTYVVDGYKLGTWVNVQRTCYKKQRNKNISPERIKRLEEIGFVWEAREAKWQENVRLLKAYKDEYGDCNVPRSYQVDGKQLGAWVKNIRNGYRSSTRNITPERVKSLESLGFDWDASQKGG
ncbi:Helicase associated domain protein [Planctomycetaceae bacterium]|nr:Helicase associated domain protein [Planctomycetaceae bacterium]